MFRKVDVIKAPEVDRNELKWLEWSQNNMEVDLVENPMNWSLEENFDVQEDLNQGVYYSDDETSNRAKDAHFSLWAYDTELTEEFEPVAKRSCS